MSAGDDLGAIADRLEQIVADLDERSLTMLRDAAAERRGRPADDKRVTQARRAVEKAIHLLRGRTADPDTDA